MRGYVLALVLVLLLGGGAVVYTKTRGLRNNNPGNIRAVAGVTWQGQVGIDGAGFVIFDTWEHGIRAMAITLRNYSRRYGLDTVDAIITRWAPSSENDTAAYIGAVAGDMNVSAGQVLSLADPATLSGLVQAIIRHENGLQPYPVASIDATVAAA